MEEVTMLTIFSIKKYSYQHLYVFSRTQAIAQTLLYHLSELANLPLPRVNDIIEKSMEFSDILPKKLDISTRNGTLVDEQGTSLFKIGTIQKKYVSKVFVKVVKSVINGTRKNDISRNVEFTRSGLGIKMSYTVREAGTYNKYEDTLLSGHVFVEHLVAHGLTYEEASKNVIRVIDLYIDKLRKRI